MPVLLPTACQRCCRAVALLTRWLLAPTLRLAVVDRGCRNDTRNVRRSAQRAGGLPRRPVVAASPCAGRCGGLGRGRRADRRSAAWAPDRMVAAGERVDHGRRRCRTGICPVRRAGKSRSASGRRVGGFVGSGGVATAVRAPHGHRPRLPQRRPALAPLAQSRRVLWRRSRYSFSSGSSTRSRSRPVPECAATAAEPARLVSCALAGGIPGRARLHRGQRRCAWRFRSATGVERLQLRWLAYTALLVPLTLLICLGGAIATHSSAESDIFNALFFFMLGAIPASIGIAVLRYRLYEIDRLISRTLVYGLADGAARRRLRSYRPRARNRARQRLGLGDRRRDTDGRGRLSTAASALQDAVDRRFRRTRFEALRRTGDSSRTCAPAASRRNLWSHSFRMCFPIPHSSSGSGCPRASSTSTLGAGP